jgi:hypothetical protein
MIVAALLLACASAPDAAGTVAASRQAAVTVSPHATRYGLTVGRSTHEDVMAWIDLHGLACDRFPSPTRTSFTYRCDGDLPVALLADRTIRGRLAQILVARPEDAPIHHFSTARRYSVPEDAIADFTSSIAAIEAELGPPAKLKPILDPSDLSRGLARFAGEWTRDGLHVTVVLLKATGDYVSVTETWASPTLAARVVERPRDGSVQGGDGKRPPGWNPHVSTIPTLSTH